ncbi:hypothetical protein [Actinomadura physcomitrii]|uniref:hypothetical protein n=1 Tax=Actinomadura physcomitrii TaxID=2650748 RepID=UPI001924DE02|nr:hypothetical protein [Actinomadura physcomitrii]
MQTKRRTGRGRGGRAHGTLSPEDGALRPAPDRPGLGLDVKWVDAAEYRVHGPG